jgi:RNA polymerase-binding protein DksA
MAGAMSDEDRQAITELLTSERERTLARIEALSRDFAEFVESSETDPPDDEHDPEGATIAWERMQTASLLDDARTHLTELGDALDRLQREDYGVCSSCGEPIAVERLMARPTTRICLTCAAAAEGWPRRGN